MVLLFEIVAVPYLTPWLGVQLAQRLGSVFEVPIYFLLPLMARIGGGDLPVTLTGLVLLFTTYVCTNSVSAHHHDCVYGCSIRRAMAGRPCRLGLIRQRDVFVGFA